MKTENRRLVGVMDFMAYTGLGRNKAMEFGKEIGCRVKVGRRVLYDLRKADEAISKMNEN